jgi:hypothetical protein
VTSFFKNTKTGKTAPVLICKRGETEEECRARHEGAGYVIPPGTSLKQYHLKGQTMLVPPGNNDV